MWFLIILAIAAIVGISIPLIGGHKIKAGNKKQDKRMVEKGTVITVEHEWNDAFYSMHYRFIADDKNEYVIIFKGTDHQVKTTIPYHEISGFEIIADNEVVGGVGRIVAGSLIAGNLGAIIGASSGGNAVSSYKGVLYRKNVSKPKYEFVLLQKRTSITDVHYRQASKFAQDVNATVKAIVSKNAQLHDSTNTSNSLSDKLSELKSAREKGLISEKEYQINKRKMLDKL